MPSGWREQDKSAVFGTAAVGVDLGEVSLADFAKAGSLFLKELTLRPIAEMLLTNRPHRGCAQETTAGD
jgi:hypothetical protein